MSPEKGTQYLQQTRNAVRHELVPFAHALVNNEPNQWWWQSARTLIRLERSVTQLPPEARAYFEERLPQVRSVLNEPNKYGTDPVLAAESMIMELSMSMAERFSKEFIPTESHFLPLEDIVRSHQDTFELTDTSLNGLDMRILHVKDQDSAVHQLPLPKNQGVWHKGGPARLVLDIIAGAPQSMINNEIPWNDLDMIATGSEEHARSVADTIGVDHDGVEILGSDQLCLQKYFMGRDTTQNQVCLGAEGIYYSSDAYETARTGHTKLVGEYIPNKAIYGMDKATIQGIELVKARGLMRLAKAVAEGKALSYDYKPINSALDLGVFWLFLARKWSKKPQFGNLMQRLYHIGAQMSQVHDNEPHVFDVLRRVHQTYPFFDMDQNIDDLTGLVRWKMRKLAKQCDREYGWEAQVPCGLQLPTSDNSASIKIYLNGFQPDSEVSDEIASYWPNFINECRSRTSVYNKGEISMYEQIFLQSDIKDHLI